MFTMNHCLCRILFLYICLIVSVSSQSNESSSVGTSSEVAEVTPGDVSTSDMTVTATVEDNTTVTDETSETTTEDGSSTEASTEEYGDEKIEEPPEDDPQNKHTGKKKTPFIDEQMLDDVGGAYYYNQSKHWLKETRKENYGGITAYEDQFPFIALITNRKMVVFTGSLLTDRWVITSAYNFIGDHHKEIDRLEEFKENGWVYVGGKAVNLLNGIAKNSTKDNRKILKIIIRDNQSVMFDTSLMRDHPHPVRYIALLRTESPFDLGENVRPVRLGMGAFPDMTTCYIVAYSEFRFPQTKWAVRWKRVQLNNRAACISHFKVALHSLSVCSAGQRGRLACTADIGSPIICDNKLVAMVTVRLPANNLYGEYKGYTSGCDEPAYFLNQYELIAPQFEWMLNYALDMPDPMHVDFSATEIEPQIEPRQPDFEDYKYVSGGSNTERTIGPLFVLLCLLRLMGYFFVSPPHTKNFLQ